MRIKEINGGYHMYLNANDTYKWAHKAGASWPCSILSNHRLFVLMDGNGLCDCTVDGKECPDLQSGELTACVSDFLPEGLQAFWPVWKYSKAI